jgi:hypothetical protein
MYRVWNIHHFHMEQVYSLMLPVIKGLWGGL